MHSAKYFYVEVLAVIQLKFCACLVPATNIPIECYDINLRIFKIPPKKNSELLNLSPKIITYPR